MGFCVARRRHGKKSGLFSSWLISTRPWSASLTASIHSRMAWLVAMEQTGRKVPRRTDQSRELFPPTLSTSLESCRRSPAPAGFFSRTRHHLLLLWTGELMIGRGWVPQGTRVGWVARSDLFLEPAASYHVAQQAAGVERLAVSEQTLRHRLREHGLLASLDVGRQMLLVRRTLEGCPRQVLHLKATQLVGP